MRASKLLKKLVVIAAILFVPAPYTNLSVTAEQSSASKPETRNLKSEADKTAVIAKTAKLQIPFIENQGQIKDKNIRFYANTFAGNVYVTKKGEIVYSLLSKAENQNSKLKTQNLEEGKKDLSRNRSSDLLIQETNTPEGVFLQTRPETRNSKPETSPQATSDQRPATKLAILKESLISAKELKITGQDKAATKVNYFVGDKKNWKNNISSYNDVSLGEVYNNIELKLKAYGKNVEKLFTVNPKGKVEDIKLKVEGAKNLNINKTGELEVSTDLGTIKFTKPVAYQQIDGKKVEVECKFQVSSLKSQVYKENPPLSPFIKGGVNFNPPLEKEGKGGFDSQPETRNLKLETTPTTYGFTVASYNPNYTLIIDPQLSYSTYLGGSGDDQGLAIAVDLSGNAYVTGWTWSTNFPIQNAYQVFNNGYYDSYAYYTDAFVTKLNSSGTALIYSTYLGGDINDRGFGIAVDLSGNAYVTGWTGSTNFPTTPGAYQTYGDGGAFVTKLNSSGTALIYSTYLGGSGADIGLGIAVDSAGNAYIIGNTTSTNFPTTQNAYQETLKGSRDVFVTKLNSSGTALIYSTYLGGNDYGGGIAVDSAGNAYVTGNTDSINFPTTPGTYQGTFGGNGDSFVTKLNSSGTALIYSTYLGGSGDDQGLGIAVDSAGNAYVTGVTDSTDFPTKNAYQETDKGGQDSFVTKLNSSGTALIYSTYLGGNINERGFGIAVDSAGNAYVTGWTNSTNFPTQSAYQGTFGGGYYSYEGDSFVTKFNSSGTALIYSTYLGGNRDEGGVGIAVDLSGNAYVTGLTDSTNFPTQSAYQGIFGGFEDAFVTKISGETPTAITLSSFTTKQKGEKIIINWQTGTEIDNLGFNVLRSETENGEYKKINKKVIIAKGKATKGANYKFADEKVKPGKTYYYKLEDIDRSGKSTLHGPKVVKVSYRRK